MKKIVGIIIVALFIGTTVPTLGMINGISTNHEIIDRIDYGYVPGEFIVKFKDIPFSSVSINNLNDKYDVISMEKIFRNPEGTTLDNIYVIQVQEDYDILSIIEDYNRDPHVVYAEPNGFVFRCGIPNDEDFNRQWSLDNTGQTGGTPDADIDAPEVWDIETGEPNVIIGIPDDGADYSHPDLVDNIWINENEIPDNGIDDDENGYIDDVRGWSFCDNDNNVADEWGHGTQCAGIAGAVSNNGIGIAGVSWNCKIMLAQIYDADSGGTKSGIASAIKYIVDNGANIISMSFGFYSGSNLIRDAVNYAYDNGIFLCAGSGNDGKSNKLYPAAYDNVTAIGATDHNDNRMNVYSENWEMWIISNYGEWVDVAAPGQNIYSTIPTYHVVMNDYGFNQIYESNHGTSFASPHVAGIAALLLSQDPTLTNDEVRKIIRANVDPYDSEYYIGTGRVNAFKALTRYNTQPEIPDTPSGKTNGKPGREYSFTTSATDDDSDDLYYFWDWGDGNYSEWLGPYSSGEECEASYTWQHEANFSIRVMVKDGRGGESYWSEEFIFSTPRIKILNNTLFERLLSRFPFFESMLRMWQLIEMEEEIYVSK